MSPAHALRANLLSTSFSQNRHNNRLRFVPKVSSGQDDIAHEARNAANASDAAAGDTVALNTSAEAEAVNGAPIADAEAAPPDEATDEEVAALAAQDDGVDIAPEQNGAPQRTPDPAKVEFLKILQRAKEA
ncbi:MAG: hypothetical protein JWN98_2085, partial [Abditibacteriota bacterium]|nr:hypothetical protein [Abditibacteriota bacterium]